VVDDQIYLGVEFAAADNFVKDGSVYLRMYPARQLVAGESTWAVRDGIIGVAAEGQVRRGFNEQYLAALARRRMGRVGAVPGNVLVYNTLYDLRGDGANSDLLIRDAGAIRQALRPWNAGLDFALIEDFWYEPNSLWGFKLTRFPNGLSDSTSNPATRGLFAGLGLSFSGAGLNPTWLGQQGYHLAGDGTRLCIADSKYNADLRDRLTNLTRKNEIGMLLQRDLKLDCRQDADGTPVDATHGRDINLNAFYAIMDTPETGRQEYRLLSPAPWPSPWWLDYMYAIRVGEPQPQTQQFDWSRPLPQPRDAAMNWNSARIHREIETMRGFVPLSGLLSPGLVKARFAPVDKDLVALDRWMDDVVLNLARGSRIQELYVSPELVSPQAWAMLARGLHWAQAEASMLRNMRWTGGDPAKGEVYGYVSQKGQVTLYVLRNPKMTADRFRVRLADLGYGPGRFWAWSEYPNRQKIADRLSRTSTLEIPLAGLETRVVEINGAMLPSLLARKFWKNPAPSAPALVKTGGGLVVAHPITSASVQLTVKAGGRAGLALLFSGAPHAADAYNLYYRVNGASASATGEQSGPDWQMKFVPLPDGKDDVRVWLEEKEGARPDPKLQVSLWGLVPGLDQALVARAMASATAEIHFLPVVRHVDEHPVAPLLGPARLGGPGGVRTGALDRPRPPLEVGMAGPRCGRP